MKKIIFSTLTTIFMISSTLFAGAVCDEKITSCGGGCPRGALTKTQAGLNITDLGSGRSKTLNSLSINVAGTAYDGNFDTHLPLSTFTTNYFVSDSSHYVLENGAVRAYSNQGATYRGWLERAFASDNLNFYHSNDGNGNKDTDYVNFFYPNLITSSADRYVMITERLGNNTQYVYAINSSGNVIGSSQRARNVRLYASSYFGTGKYVNTSTGGQQELYIAMWPMTAFVPEGTKIAGFRLRQMPSESTNNVDAGDGKLLLFAKSSSLACTIDAVGDDFRGTSLDVGQVTPSVLNNDRADDNLQATDTNIHDNISLTNLDGLPVGTTITTDGRIRIVSGTASGDYSPIYRICLAKDTDFCDTARVQIRVQNRPTAIDDVDNTDQGLSILVDVLANDTHNDPVEVPNLTIISSTASANGVTSIDDKGTATPTDDEILYTPNAGYYGTDSFQYTIEDSIGQTDTATVNITIVQAPDTFIDNHTVIEGGDLLFRFTLSYLYAADITYQLAITNNTTDDNDHNGTTIPLTLVIPANTFGATFVLPTINDPVDEPIDIENLTLSIVSTDSDIGDTSDTGIGYIIDDDFSPEAQDDYVTTDQGLSVDIFALANDTHPTVWEKIRLVAVNTGTNGSTSIDDKGTPEPEDDIIVYTPNPGYVGTDSFEYTVRDIQGNEDTAMVYITIDSAPDVTIEGNTNADGDTRVEGNDLIFKLLLSKPYRADIELTLLVTNNTTDDNDHRANTTTMKATIKNGSLFERFRLPTIDDPVDEVDSENLTISIVSASTEIGDISDTAFGYILDNDKSPIAENDSDKTDQGLPVSIKVLTNDYHPTAGEEIRIISSTVGTNGTTSIDNKGTSDTEDDEIIYTPNNTFFGTDTFEYTIEDLQGNQDTATVSIEIRQAPSILIADSTIPEGGFLTFFVTVSHPYGADIVLDLGYINNTTTDEDHRATRTPLTITIPKGKLLVKFRLQTVDDLLDEDDSENLTLLMTGVTPSFLPIPDTAIGYILDNDFAAVAYDDYHDGVNSLPSTICVLKNDLDGSSDIDKDTLRIIDNGSNVETLSVTGEGVWTIDRSSGCIIFTPELDYIGDPAPIEYYVEDEGTNPTTAIVTINYPPLALPDFIIGNVNDEITLPVLDNDRETNSSINISSVRIINEDLQEVTSLYIENKGMFKINDDGTVTFTPDLNFDGEVIAPYVFRDDNGDVSNRAEITILYPILRDDLLLSEYVGGHIESFNIIENDSEEITDISLIGSSRETILTETSQLERLEGDDNNTLDDEIILTELKVAGEGVWTLNDGEITFTPDEGFYRNPTPINYTAKYRGYQINSAKITIIYEESVPLALDNLGIPIIDFEAQIIDVLDNDTFGRHGVGKALIYWTNPKHGRILINTKGTPFNPSDDVLIYKADNVDYVGLDEFEYTITDLRGQTSTARVTMNVACSTSQAEDSVSISKYLLFLFLLPLLIIIRRKK